MSATTPQITVLFLNRTQRSIANVADAAETLASTSWPRKNTAEYRETVRIVDEAMAGHCKPSVALDAFKRLATDAGVLVATPAAK